MRNDFWGKSIGGFVLIGIGIVFLLNQTDVIDVDLGYIVSHFWPVVLIAIGLQGLFAQRHHRHGGGFIWGLLMIGLGLAFLNNNFGWIPDFGIDDLFKFAIPVVLILFGFRMLFRPKPPQKPYTPKDWQPYSSGVDGTIGMGPDEGVNGKGPDAPFGGEPPLTPPPPPPPPERPHWNGHREQWHEAKQEWKRRKREWKHEFKHEWKQYKHGYSGHSSCDVDNRHNFIGDLRIGRDYWELRPLNVSHFIGDTEIDLTRANIPYGETTITVSAFIGDVKVYVPNDVQLDVSVQASAFLGDMSVFDRWEGGLFRNMRAESPQYHEAEKRIRIQVSMFIGDVRVKRVG
ncbi:cell wall-active antibiotics response protein LiaF [Paenibacillus flagellatus]|uniref:Cell wall-active antibiotics response protein n=1 Tax=Paenibacillus flagellatus TaxID=2211139 RepID=A0A2V5KCR7_9BACL|nr:cell wall-active antibiotics response protein LiaF [Paenibacillus flagellatus]PYI57429.1 cell wall-active antibiotics response protein [Paenibacillus flagellatus]